MANYKRQMGIEEDKDSPAYGRVTEARRMDAPSKYDSIRPSGEEDRLSVQKRRGLTQAVLGAVTAPVGVAVETLMGGRSGAEALTEAPSRALKSAKESADVIGSGINQYQNADQDEKSLDRELDSQTKRETRGMKKGGSVGSASSRGDGIAQRGKTRGRYL